MRLPPSLLTALQDLDPAPSWPSAVGADPDVRAAVEQALQNAGPELRAILLERLLGGPVSTWWATRASLWTDALVRRAGGTFRETGRGPLLGYDTPDGRSVWMAPLSFRTLEQLSGSPEAVRRLVSSLETVLLPHRFAVHFREPVGADVDASGVVAAAFGWIRDVERGMAPRTASFDDDESNLHIDIDLLVGEGASHAWFVAPPLRGPEWLGLIDRRLQQLLEAVPPGEPIIPVLCADPRWSLARGFQCQWLYGTPQQVSVPEVGAARIRWPEDGGGFFADPIAKSVASVWWIETGAHGPLSMQGWAHDNPAAPDPGFAFPGARLGRDPTAPEWSWDTRPPSTWEAP